MTATRPFSSPDRTAQFGSKGAGIFLLTIEEGLEFFHLISRVNRDLFGAALGDDGRRSPGEPR